MTQKPESTPPLDSLPKRKAFDAHLDDCKRCEQNPMGLCPVGGPLLREAALEAANELGDQSMVEAFRKTNAQVDEAMEQLKKPGGARPEGKEELVKVKVNVEVFDAHFDECVVCNSSSDVCSEGLAMLRKAVIDVVSTMGSTDLFSVIDDIALLRDRS